MFHNVVCVPKSCNLNVFFFFFSIFFVLEPCASKCCTFNKLHLFMRQRQVFFKKNLNNYQLFLFSLTILYGNEGSIFKENKFEEIANHTSYILTKYNLPYKAFYNQTVSTCLIFDALCSNF